MKKYIVIFKKKTDNNLLELYLKTLYEINPLIII